MLAVSADEIERKSIVPRQPPTPEDHLLTNLEAMHLRALRENQWLFGFSNLQRFRGDGHRLWECVFRRFGTNLSSKTVRYGCVLYSLYHLRHIMPNDDLQMDYLDLFYKSTRDAVNHQEFADLVYGCFAGCMFALRTRRTFDEIEVHAQGFQLSVSGLTATYSLSAEEMFLLECMWEKMIWYMAQHVFSEPSPTTAALRRLAQSSKPLFCTDYKEQPGWMQDSYCEVEVKIEFVKLAIPVGRRVGMVGARADASLLQN